MTTGGVKDTVDKIIRTHKVAIFSRQGCPYCLGARNTIRKFIGKRLSQSDVAFYNIDKENDSREMQNYLKLITGASSVI
jgi:glutaredoxin